MNFPGMTTEASYATNLEWGDSALANFFGTTASADAADPVDFSFIQLNRAPETLRSNFVTDAQTSFYRLNRQTSKRFGLGTIPGNPVSDSAGDALWGMTAKQAHPHSYRWIAIAVVALAAWYFVGR